MITEHTQSKLTWIDVLSPTNEEVRTILDTYEIPPALLGDLLTPVPRSTAVSEGNVLKVTLDFPVIKQGGIESMHEIKFIITKNTLISVRYDDIEALHQFRKEFEVISTLYTTGRGANGMHLFYGLIGELYSSLDAQLDYLETKLGSIEEEIFSQHEKEMVFAISDASRRLIAFRQALKSHEDVLRTLKTHVVDCFNVTTGDLLADYANQYYFLVRRANGMFETLDELRETNFALLSTKQNEIMKILTIMAFVTFPLSLFASIFGMNTATLPLTGFPGDFWLIVGIMAVLTISFFVFFKIRRWI